MVTEIIRRERNFYFSGVYKIRLGMEIVLSFWLRLYKCLNNKPEWLLRRSWFPPSFVVVFALVQIETVVMIIIIVVIIIMKSRARSLSSVLIGYANQPLLKFFLCNRRFYSPKSHHSMPPTLRFIFGQCLSSKLLQFIIKNIVQHKILYYQFTQRPA